MQVHEAVLKAVAVVCLDLTDDEALACYMALSLSGDIRGKLGAEKLSSLYNQDGTMHEDTKRALSAVLDQRISEMRGE